MRSLAIPAVLLTFATLVAGNVSGGNGFAVIVHRSNSVPQLRISEVRLLFTGENRRWPNSAKVILAEQDRESPSTRFLLQRLLNISGPEYKRRIENIAFTGQERIVLRVLNSDEAACKFVYNVPGAVAIVEIASLSTQACHDVHVVKIEGHLPGDEEYGMK